MVALGLAWLGAIAAVAAAPRHILLVDDDFAGNNNAKGTGALSGSDQVYRKLVQEFADATGASWDVVVVDSYSNGPNLEHLRGYDLVIWYTGASYGGNSDNTSVLSKIDEAALAAYLNVQPGAAVVIISPGYVSKVLGGQGWDNATWPFLRSVLSLKGGSGLAKRSADGRITGADGQFFTVNRLGAAEAQFSLVNPDQAETIFTMTLPGAPWNGKPAAVATACSYAKGKIVYAGFTLENLPTVDATTVFRRLLTAAGLDVTVTTPVAKSPAIKLSVLNQALKPGAQSLANPGGTAATVVLPITPPSTPAPAVDPGAPRTVVTGNPNTTAFVAPAAAPAGPPPTNLQFSSNGPASHNLTWAATAWKSFRVYRKYNDEWKQLADNVTNPLYTDQSLALPNTVYRVTVVHVDQTEGSVEGTYAAPPQAPIPQNLRAVQSGEGMVKVTWDSIFGASGYQVYGPTLPVKGTKVLTPTLDLTSVPVGTHQIRVAAIYNASETVLTASTTITVKTTEARYRLVMLGAKAIVPTADDPLQLDGKGDEIYAGAYWVTVPAAGDAVMGGIVRSQVYGDTQGFPNRIAAGSAGPTGGLKAGDTIPSANALLTQINLATTTDRFPLLVWEGILSDKGGGVAVLPALFEWDNGSDNAWNAWKNWGGSAEGLRVLAENGRNQMRGGDYQDFVSLTSEMPGTGTEANGYTVAHFGPNIDNDGDRPIGVKDVSPTQSVFSHIYLQFLPRGFVLSRARVEQLLGTQDVARIQGNFTETAPYNGYYTLYFQIERMDPTTPAPAVLATTPNPVPGSALGARTPASDANVTFVVPGASGAKVSGGENSSPPSPSTPRTVTPSTGTENKLGALATPAPTGAPPTNLKVVPLSAAAHEISWNAPESGSFSVYRKDPEGWHQIATDTTTRSYIDVAFVAPGIAYRVEWRHASGAVGMAEVTYANPLQPAIVTELKATQTGPGMVHLSWKSPGGGGAPVQVYGPGTPPDGLRVGGSSVDLTAVPVGTQSYRVAILYGYNNVSVPAPTTANTSLEVLVDHGRYRVSILGISAAQQTTDDPLERDGKGDEVYLGVYSAFITRNSGRPVTIGIARTVVMGDTNGFPARLRAGSAGPTGGIQSGDYVPSAAAVTPHPGVSTASDRFPLAIWDGELSDAGPGVLVSPQLFEWDDGNPPPWDMWAGWWTTPAGAPMAGDTARAQFAADIGEFDLTTKYALPPDKDNYVNYRSYGIGANGPGDRGIGLREQPQPDAPFSGSPLLVLVPQGILLTRHNVEKLLGTNSAAVFRFGHSDYDAFMHNGALNGSYSIYIQIERVAGP